MFARFLRRLARNTDGVGALEFALCLPVFLMMLVGTLQFGWTQHEFSSIRFALQKASRALVINPDTTEATLQGIVNSQLSKATQTQVDVSLQIVNTANGKLATVGAEYDAEFGVPFIATFEVPYQVQITTALRNIP